MFFHKHRWSFVEGRKYTYVRSGGAVTTAYLVCKICGKPATDEIKGHVPDDLLQKLYEAGKRL